MDVRLRKLAAGQDDLVAAWQLMRLGWSRTMVRHRLEKEGWRTIHDGVYALAQAPLTQRQLWVAAVLTAPRTHLFAESACACHGFAEWHGGHEVVVRPGNGGPRRCPGLLIARSRSLRGQTTTREGIPIVAPPAALISVALRWDRRRLARGFREAIRLKTTTANEIARALSGQRGTRALRDLCDRYASIPYHRCRSDAESRALEVLRDAEVPAPQVNVRVNGVEADLVWRHWRLIVEIDGGQFHLFTDEDARKEFAWRCAGYTVHRIPSDDVYHRAERLPALVNVHRAAL